MSTAEFSQVRHNLMTRPGYSPYCGNFDKCPTMPRTRWTGDQFRCGCCGWVSAFPDDFIEEYKAVLAGHRAGPC